MIQTVIKKQNFDCKFAPLAANSVANQGNNNTPEIWV